MCIRDRDRMDIGMNDINALYTLWREKAVLDPDLKAELDAVAGQELSLIHI